MSSFWSGLFFWRGIQLSKKTEKVLLEVLTLIVSLLCVYLFVENIEALIGLLMNGVSVVPWTFLASFLLWIIGWCTLLFAQLYGSDFINSLRDKREGRQGYNSVNSFTTVSFGTICLVIVTAFCWGTVLVVNSSYVGWVITLAASSVLAFYTAVKS